jgi:hypothetical protein
MTPLSKPLKRALKIRDREFVVTLSPQSIKVTAKGKRNGLELHWIDLVTGDAALATALNASIGTLAVPKETPRSRLRSAKHK